MDAFPTLVDRQSTGALGEGRGRPAFLFGVGDRKNLYTARRRNEQTNNNNVIGLSTSSSVLYCRFHVADENILSIKLSGAAVRAESMTWYAQ